LPTLFVSERGKTNSKKGRSKEKRRPLEQKGKDFNYLARGKKRKKGMGGGKQFSERVRGGKRKGLLFAEKKKKREGPSKKGVLTLCLGREEKERGALFNKEEGENPEKKISRVRFGGEKKKKRKSCSRKKTRERGGKKKNVEEELGSVVSYHRKGRKKEKGGGSCLRQIGKKEEGESKKGKVEEKPVNTNQVVDVKRGKEGLLGKGRGAYAKKKERNRERRTLPV